MKRCALSVAAACSALMLASPALAALPSGWSVAEGAAPSADARPEALRARVTSVVPMKHEPVATALRDLPRHVVGAPGPLPQDEGPSYFDGFGRPLDRLDVAPHGGELYVVPPGTGGRLRVGDMGTFWNNDEPFFNGPRERERGFGVHFPWNSRIPGELAITWHSIEAQGEQLRFRSVKGTFDRFAGTVVQREWIDTPTRSFLGGLVHAFVSERDGMKTVHVVVPSGSMAYASPHVAAISTGDFFFGSRMPFTELRLPLTSLRSAAAGIDVSTFAMARYRAAGGSTKDLFGGRIHVAVSEDGLVVATTGSS